jgi:hypothetical protein
MFLGNSENLVLCGGLFLRQRERQIKTKNNISYKILLFYGGEYLDFGLKDFTIVLTCRYLPRFWRKTLPLSLQAIDDGKQSKTFL